MIRIFFSVHKLFRLTQKETTIGTLEHNRYFLTEIYKRRRRYLLCSNVPIVVFLTDNCFFCVNLWTFILWIFYFAMFDYNNRGK